MMLLQQEKRYPKHRGCLIVLLGINSVNGFSVSLLNFRQLRRAPEVSTRRAVDKIY